MKTHKLFFKDPEFETPGWIYWNNYTSFEAAKQSMDHFFHHEWKTATFGMIEDNQNNSSIFKNENSNPQ